MFLVLPFHGAIPAFPVGMARDRRLSKTQSQRGKIPASHEPSQHSWPA
jgi:hypothetical protein